MVGAPHFFDRHQELGGAAYVYINPSGRWEGARPLRLNGPPGSMFGVTVGALGDLNQDGFEGERRGQGGSFEGRCWAESLCKEKGKGQVYTWVCTRVCMHDAGMTWCRGLYCDMGVHMCVCVEHVSCRPGPHVHNIGWCVLVQGVWAWCGGVCMYMQVCACMMQGRHLYAQYWLVCVGAGRLGLAWGRMHVYAGMCMCDVGWLPICTVLAGVCWCRG